MGYRLLGRSGCAVSQAGKLHYAGLSNPYGKRGQGRRDRRVPGGRF